LHALLEEVFTGILDKLVGILPHALKALQEVLVSILQTVGLMLLPVLFLMLLLFLQLLMFLQEVVIGVF